MHFDLVVIGAGPGGYEIAAEEAAAGKSVAIIEKDLPGGTCLNRGCIPTKCLCSGANSVVDMQRAFQSGLFNGHIPVINYAASRAHADSVINNLREGIKSMIGKCTYIQGEACFMPDGSIKVDDQILTGDKVLIATGSKPAVLDIEGHQLAKTSDEFLSLTDLPHHIAIIGGGVIGLEFAFIANAFGSEVTIIEYCKEILPGFDNEVGKRLRMFLSGRGVKFLTSASVRKLLKENEHIQVVYEDKKGHTQIDTDCVVMAVGRRAVIPDGVRELGIEIDQRGFIVTNDSMETSRKGIYAVGDCNGKLMLAHVAAAQARKAMGQTVDLDVVPAVVFTNPELASVGLTTEQCKERNLPYRSVKGLYRANGKALASDEGEGFVKILIDTGNDRILGAHILGAHASDLIAELALAISAGLTVEDILKTIHSHPSLSEIIFSALR